MRDDLEKFGQTISELGEAMVKCSETCVGVERDPTAGIPPRGLMLETIDRTGDRGCVIVGTNPGTILEDEQAFYRRNGPPTYERLRTYFIDALRCYKHYVPPRTFVTERLGLLGPILWTDMAKCHWIRDTAKGPSGKARWGTLKKCGGIFLSSELSVVPQEWSWPVIALGNDAFRHVTRLPDRLVIGVVHPQAWHGGFLRLLRNNEVGKRLHRLFAEGSRGRLKIGDGSEWQWMPYVNNQEH